MHVILIRNTHEMNEKMKRIYKNVLHGIHVKNVPYERGGTGVEVRKENTMRR